MSSSQLWSAAGRWALGGLLWACPAAAQRISVPASLTVGDQRVGTISGPIDLLIQNTGASPLRVTGASISGTHEGDFGLLSTPTEMRPLVVAPGGSGPLQLAFKPTAAGMRMALLTLLSNDPMGSTSVALQGRGVVAGFRMTPADLVFARQRTGGCTPAQLVRIDNPGTDRLRISGLTFTGAGASSFSTSTSPFHIAPMGTGYVDVRLCPRQIGMLSARLVVATDLMVGHTAEVALTGTGFGPVIEVAPSALDFGSVHAGTPSRMQTVTLRNVGDEDTVIAMVALAGADASQFSLMSPPPATRIGAGSSLQVEVAARPADAGPRRAELIITLAEELVPGRQLRVPLAAMGIVASLGYGPASIECGMRFVGTSGRCRSALEIRNLGAQAVEGLTVTATLNDFRIDSVPAMIPPQQAAMLPLSFRPLASGDRRGMLVLRARGLLGMHQVPVSGTGLGVSLQLSPQTIQFGAVEIGAEPAPMRQLLVVNQGSHPLEAEVVLDPPAPEEFAIEPTALTLLPQEPQAIQVRFVPRQEGDRTLLLHIQHREGEGLIESVEIEARAYFRPQPPSSAGCAAAAAAPAPSFPMCLVQALLLLPLLRGRRLQLPVQRGPGQGARATEFRAVPGGPLPHTSRRT